MAYQRMFKQILAGLFVALMGSALAYFSQSVADLFGRIDWFERNLGGTRNGYVVIGFLTIVIGFLILFGVIPISASVVDQATSVAG